MKKIWSMSVLLAVCTFAGFADTSEHPSQEETIASPLEFMERENLGQSSSLPASGPPTGLLQTEDGAATVLTLHDGTADQSPLAGASDLLHCCSFQGMCNTYGEPCPPGSRPTSCPCDDPDS